MAGFENFKDIDPSIIKKLKYLQEPFYYLYKDSGGKTLRGTLFEMTESDYEKACTRLTGVLQGEILSGDQVYVLPNCRIPKFKLEDYMDSIGAHLTDDITAATKIVGHTKIMDEPVSQAAGTALLLDLKNTVLKSGFKANRSWGSPAEIEKDNAELTKKFHTAVDNYTVTCSIQGSETVISPRVWGQNYWNSGYTHLSAKHKRFITPTGAWIIYNQILHKVPVLNEGLIFEKIGKPIILDQETCTSILDMISSQDQDNHKVGAELLANCDIDKSLFYIWKLAREKGWVVSRLSRFKNIRLFIRMSNWAQLGGLDEEAFIEYMYQKNLLTKEYFDELCPKAADKYTGMLRSPVFGMTLEPGDKYKEFRTDSHKYQFNTTPDPVVIVEEDEI